MIGVDAIDQHVSKMEGRLDVRNASVRVVQFSGDQPQDGLFPWSEDFVIDLCAGPRVPSARGCFTECWAAHRFEPLGKIYAVPPRHKLRARSEGGHQKSIICWIEGATIAAAAERQIEWSDSMLRASLDISSPAIAMILRRMALEACRPGFASDTMVELLAQEAAIELLRYLMCLPRELRSGGLAPRHLRTIDERIEAGGGGPTLKELSELCGLSVRQLTRGYRHSRGTSIHRAISDRRIEVAWQLLSQGAPVKTVAIDLGFASPSAFTYAFRRATGMAPSVAHAYLDGSSLT